MLRTKEKNVLRMVLVGCSAWIAGLVAYESTLRVIWRQSMGADWRSVVFWSALALIVVAPLVYTPAMFGLRKILKGYRPLAWFPSIGALLASVPTAIVIFTWGGGLHDLISPEAIAFDAMFAVFGLVFGLGFALNRACPPDSCG
jgi:hypothetical protein